MPLVTCPDCKKDISDRAPTCPSCGAPQGKVSTANAVQVNVHQPRKFKGPPHECRECGGPLRKTKEATSSGSGCIILILGICLAPVLIGIPIILYGIHLMGKRKALWQCKECDATFPRKLGMFEFG